jgi:hypothetical protein
MTFIPKNATSKNWKLRFYKKTASAAFANGALVDWPASPTGYFVAATNATTKVCGIIQKTVATTDSDYASNTAVPVLVPATGNVEVIATTTGTAVATDVGGRYDLSDSVTVNRAASTVGRVLMTEFISATSAVYELLIPGVYAASA